jgi:hypothetical protein
MSDLMLYGILRMPYELAMEGDISRLQFYQRAQEAANRLERADAEIADLRAALVDADRKNLELTRVNHEQRLQEKRLEQALAAKAVPDGWKLVPVEPTEEMLYEALKVDDKAYADGSQHGASIGECWDSMLAAAPSPAQQEG